MYDELVTALRKYSCPKYSDGCGMCPAFKYGCAIRAVQQAADAIEALSKRVPPVPHGDLIDRRETIIDANERAYDFWLSDDEVNATIQFLKEQPTILPAEEE